jgi:hypothetical protein
MNSQIEKATKFLKDRYDIDVIIRDFSEDEGVDIGAIRHKKILIDRRSRGELGILFVMAHLFGHMVQFTDYEKYRHIVETEEKNEKPIKLSDEFKKEFFDYEVEGYRIGKSFMKEVLGESEVEAVDEKYQIYLNTDFELFWNYLTKAEHTSIEDFNVILEERYRSWSGKYPQGLLAIPLPEIVDPKKDIVIF